MKKEKSKPTANPETAAEPAVSAAIEQVPQGQALPVAEHIQLPEVAEQGEQRASGVILAEEYFESTKFLRRSETTEQDLSVQAERQGKQPDEVISAFIHEQLPRQDFYDQPVLLGN